MPHLYKPWKHGRPVEHATVFASNDENRRALRDARTVRLVGIALLVLSIGAFMLDQGVLGLVLLVAGFGMAILDTGVVLVFGSLGIAIYALVRLLARAARRAVPGQRR